MERAGGEQVGGARVVPATVVRSNVNREARATADAHRYDVVLDVLADGGPPWRIELVDVRLGPMLPMIGSTVTVRLGAGDADTGGGAVTDGARLEILWRGDPNLDLDAHRRQLAALAEAARRRRPRDTDDTIDEPAVGADGQPAG